MDVTSAHLLIAARKHWFWFAMALVIYAGYQVGKDRAFRDNAVERAAQNPG